MKISNRLNSLSISIRCLLLVALCSTATALVQQGDQTEDPGNQDCNTTSAEMTTNPVTGRGSEWRYDNDGDHWFAEQGSMSDLREKIAEASGVVCKKCEDERRCTRTTKTTSGTLVQVWASIMPVPDVHDGGWICESTWTGKYKIKCEKC